MDTNNAGSTPAAAQPKPAPAPPAPAPKPSLESYNATHSSIVKDIEATAGANLAAANKDAETRRASIAKNYDTEIGRVAQGRAEAQAAGKNDLVAAYDKQAMQYRSDRTAFDEKATADLTRKTNDIQTTKANHLREIDGKVSQHVAERNAAGRSAVDPIQGTARENDLISRQTQDLRNVREAQRSREIVR